MISNDQKETYLNDGYLLIPRLLAGETNVLKDEASKISEIYEKQQDEKILAIHKPHYESEVLKSFVTHDRIATILSEIVDLHLPFKTGNVKCAYSILFLKPPGLPGQAWHQDESYVPSRDRSLTAAWIAIDDSTLENGCLWVLPGSHKRGYLYPTRDHNKAGEFDENDEAYGFDDRGAVPLEMPAGSVAFFNGYLLHRSFKNSSNDSRRNLVSHYLRSESYLPWFDLSNGLPVSRADNRKIIHISGDDPYEWKGYAALDDKPYLRIYR